MGRHRNGEDTDHGQAGDQDRECLRHSRGKGVAAIQSHELAIRPAYSFQRLLFSSVGHELRRAAKQLDQICGQLGPCACLTAANGAIEQRGDEWDEDAAEEKPDGENRGRAG